jgi:hypothetical protein
MTMYGARMPAGKGTCIQHTLRDRTVGQHSPARLHDDLQAAVTLHDSQKERPASCLDLPVSLLLHIVSMTAEQQQGQMSWLLSSRG